MDDLLGQLQSSLQNTNNELKNNMSKEKKELLAKEEAYKKQKAEEMKKLKEKFKKDMEKFIAHVKVKEMNYPPMDNRMRLIVHQVAEEFKLHSYSFGVEDAGTRFVMVFKQDNHPDEDRMERLKARYDPDYVIKPKPKIVDKSEIRRTPSYYTNKNKGKNNKNSEALGVTVELEKMEHNKRDRRTLEEIAEEVKRESKRRKLNEEKGKEKGKEMEKEEDKNELNKSGENNKTEEIKEKNKN